MKIAIDIEHTLVNEEIDRLEKELDEQYINLKLSSSIHHIC